MSLIQDLANGKELSLSSGSKLTIQYEVDSDVMKLSIGGNSVDLSADDINKLIAIEGVLRTLKGLESKV